MITPLPQTAVPPLDPRAPGDPRDGQAPDDLFAQLLGAGFAAAPLVESVDVPTAMPVPASAAARGADAGETVPAPLARVFNQDGFFEQAPGVAAAGKPASPIPVAVADKLFRAPGPDIERAAADAPSPQARFPIGAGLRNCVAAPPPASGTRPQNRSLATGTSPALIRAETVAISATETHREPLEAQPLRRLFRGVLAAQSPIQVAVHEAEHGLQVAAYVAGLDEAERRQLHEAIAALLARHGLRPAHIRINVTPTRGAEA